MLTGHLFHIQKFSLHDGPGIRTTVFFKGCPLRCRWCANPESISGRIEVLATREKCVGCGVCVEACPQGALAADIGAVRVVRHRCVGCGECVAVCPEEALSLSGRVYTVAEVVEECLRDRDFYDESGGGVTLSGGEATMQPDFAVALLRRLRALGVHTALETNGFAPGETFRRVASEADLLLFDVKHYDASKHREGVGADNAVILENLAWALAAGRAVIVRIPVIRGYSDSTEDARGFGKLLRQMGIRRAQLLPFHQMGEKKYESLGMDYSLKGMPSLHKEDLLEYRRLMAEEGEIEVEL